MFSSGSKVQQNAREMQAAFSRLDQDPGVTTENKLVISKFANTWLAKGFTRARVVKLIYTMRQIARRLNKNLGEATKEDMIQLIGQIEQTEYADNTKRDLKVILKTFYKWLKGNDETVPLEVSWIRTQLKNRGHKLPEELLTEDDVMKIAQAATNLRDKALVLILYETGCRIGELLSLKMKNISFDQYGAILKVSGKTGDRRVRIISSAPTLTAWIENYEGAKNPEASLWPPRSGNNHKTDYASTHRSVYKTLQLLAIRAGIRKKVYPHLFRHSRATFMASKFTEAQMKEYFGWTQSSEMAAIYVHLSGRDVDDALIKMHNLDGTTPKVIEPAIQIKNCQRCKERNSPIASFCNRCGNPLDIMLQCATRNE